MIQINFVSLNYNFNTKGNNKMNERNYKPNYNSSNILDRINEIHLNNSDVGQFKTYFINNNNTYIVFELLTYVLNSNLEIISCSINKGI